MTKQLNLVFFPDALIRLSRETARHPKLIEQLGEVSPHELELRLAVIAGYCEVILDGVYTQPELEKLADILCERLKAKAVSPSIILIN